MGCLGSKGMLSNEARKDVNAPSVINTWND